MKIKEYIESKISERNEMLSGIKEKLNVQHQEIDQLKKKLEIENNKLITDCSTEKLESVLSLKEEICKKELTYKQTVDLCNEIEKKSKTIDISADDVVAEFEQLIKSSDFDNLNKQLKSAKDNYMSTLNKYLDAVIKINQERNNIALVKELISKDNLTHIDKWFNDVYVNLFPKISSFSVGAFGGISEEAMNEARIRQLINDSINELSGTKNSLIN